MFLNSTRLYNIKEIYIFPAASALIFFIDLDLTLYIALEAILLIDAN